MTRRHLLQYFEALETADDYVLSDRHPDPLARWRPRTDDRVISVALYEHTDIPPGMTCDEYRRRSVRSDRPRSLAESLGLALLYPARLLAHLTESGPAPGACPAALYVSSNLSHGQDRALP
jgi:hypothetical protein